MQQSCVTPRPPAGNCSCRNSPEPWMLEEDNKQHGHPNWSAAVQYVCLRYSRATVVFLLDQTNQVSLDSRHSSMSLGRTYSCCSPPETTLIQTATATQELHVWSSSDSHRPIAILQLSNPLSSEFTHLRQPQRWQRLVFSSLKS